MTFRFEGNPPGDASKEFFRTQEQTQRNRGSLGRSSDKNVTGTKFEDNNQRGRHYRAVSPSTEQTRRQKAAPSRSAAKIAAPEPTLTLITQRAASANESDWTKIIEEVNDDLEMLGYENPRRSSGGASNLATKPPACDQAQPRTFQGISSEKNAGRVAAMIKRFDAAPKQEADPSSSTEETAMRDCLNQLNALETEFSSEKDYKFGRFGNRVISSKPHHRPSAKPLSGLLAEERPPIYSAPQIRPVTARVEFKPTKVNWSDEGNADTRPSSRGGAERLSRQNARRTLRSGHKRAKSEASSSAKIQSPPALISKSPRVSSTGSPPEILYKKHAQPLTNGEPNSPGSPYAENLHSKTLASARNAGEINVFRKIDVIKDEILKYRALGGLVVVSEEQRENYAKRLAHAGTLDALEKHSAVRTALSDGEAFVIRLRTLFDRARGADATLACLDDALARETFEHYKNLVLDSNELLEKTQSEVGAGRRFRLKKVEFLISDRLGSGAHGDVFACSAAKGQAVALKIPHNPFADARKQRLQLESAGLEADAQIRASQGASHVLQLRGVVVLERLGACLITELADLGAADRVLADLAALVERKMISAPSAWSLRREIVRDVAMGLDEIHSRGVLHLDLNPSNIFITAEGVAKIGDFGRAVIGRAAYASIEKLDTPGLKPPDVVCFERARRDQEPAAKRGRQKQPVEQKRSQAEARKTVEEDGAESGSASDRDWSGGDSSFSVSLSRREKGAQTARSSATLETRALLLALIGGRPLKEAAAAFDAVWRQDRAAPESICDGRPALAAA